MNAARFIVAFVLCLTATGATPARDFRRQSATSVTRARPENRISVMLALAKYPTRLGPSHAVWKWGLLQLRHALVPTRDLDRMRTVCIECGRVVTISDLHDHDQAIAGAVDLHFCYPVTSLRLDHGLGSVAWTMGLVVRVEQVSLVVQVHDPDYPSRFSEHAGVVCAVSPCPGSAEVQLGNGRSARPRPLRDRAQRRLVEPPGARELSGSPAERSTSG